jgi:poly(A) polymerase
MQVDNLPSPIRISPPTHGIHSHQISKAALEVIAQLHKAGFEAYVVGGGVRDLLLGHHPKDFDIATNALPEEIRPLFRRCFLIGRRFRLAHVYVGRDVIEVATFRGQTKEASSENHSHATSGMILRDNVYGTLAEDAIRRDFSINALYYNPQSGEVIDFTVGFADCHQKTLRIIGDPEQRYREDPVRMLRALRFMGKLGFHLHPDTADPIPKLAHLLVNIPNARLSEELNKLFLHGHALINYRLLKEYGLLPLLLLPVTETNPVLATEVAEALIEQALQNTDSRVKQHKPVTPAFLFAALLWQHYCVRQEYYYTEQKQSFYLAGLSAASDVLSKQTQRISIPKRLGLFIRETWSLQPRLTNIRRRQIMRLLHHPRFRAAYDFLLLRVAAGEPYIEQSNWWTALQDANDKERHELLQNIP